MMILRIMAAILLATLPLAAAGRGAQINPNEKGLAVSAMQLRQYCQLLTARLAEFPSTVEWIGSPSFFEGSDKKTMMLVRLEFEAKNQMGAVLPYAVECKLSHKGKLNLVGLGPR